MNTTSKKIAPPPLRKSRLNIPAPMLEVTPDNLSKPSDSGATTYMDMNFKVEPAFHKRFKTEATLRGLTMKDLLEASFKLYLEQNGGTIERVSPELF